MKKLKIAIISCIALGATALTAFSQSSVGTGGNNATYGVGTLTLPYTTLAAGTATNLINGWTNTVTSSTTNITYYLTNNAIGWGMITNVTTITNNSVTLPLISCGFQKDLTLGMSFTASGAGTNTLVWARSLDGTPANAELNNEFSLPLGVTGAATTPQTIYTNLPQTFVGGDGYVILVSNIWTSASGILTNGFGGAGIQYGIKRGAR